MRSIAGPLIFFWLISLPFVGSAQTNRDHSGVPLTRFPPHGTPTPSASATPTPSATDTPAPSATDTPGPSAAAGGIYVINAVLNGAIAKNILSNPNLDGIVLGVNWKDVEPTEDTFDWSPIDPILAQAAAAGKRVSLVLTAGWETPDWLYADGAQPFHFVWDLAKWGAPLCSVVTMPVPWDQVYLAKWGVMVAALGERYRTNPTVVSVKVTGVNSKTGEIFLPTAVKKPIQNGSTACTSYDDVANWQLVGYTRLKAEGAWNSMMQMFAQAFPETKLQAMLVPGGFPAIDDNGNRFSSSSNQDFEVTSDIIASGIAEYPAQFTIQNDGWSATWDWKTVSAYANQVMTGFQEVGPLGSQTAAAITLALASSPNYLELYPGDAVSASSQTALATAHQALQ